MIFFLFEDTNVQDEEKDVVSLGLKSRERKCAFSLDFRSFGPLVLDGARSKVVLRGEGYAWTPIWWSFEKSKR